MEYFVGLLSNEGDIVFDPFAGSGSSGVAALTLHRQFIGAEINQTYYQVSLKRLNNVIDAEH